MRTEPPSPLASALGRLRVAAGRARRWLAARGAVARVALLVVGLSGLGAVGYLASLDDPGERSWAWIYENRRLSGDDIARISEALDVAGIPHAATPQGRVGVKPARRQDALAALAKAKAVPPSLDQLGRGDEPGLFDGPEERDRRENDRLERTLKVEIEGLDPAIASAIVTIHRPRRRAGPASHASEAGGYVYLDTKDGQKLPLRVVEGIETFLTGSVPGLKADSITVADRTGRKYLVAGNASLKEQMQAHAREEAWRDAIAEDLRHIPGVGVSVLLEAAPAPAPPPQAEPPPPAAFEVVTPNGPVALLEHDPAPAPAANAPSGHPSRDRANVWVRVPRSFYLLEFQSRSPGRQPSQDDLEPMRLTTERLIRDAVEIHIPKDELGGVKVSVIQDDLASSRPMMLPPEPESRRPWAWLALSGALGVAGLGLVALTLALVRMAARRPSARPSGSAWRPGFVADGPSPGPSERVRELIRLNPEAAAGVLQRWIGQGGALP